MSSPTEVGPVVPALPHTPSIHSTDDHTACNSRIASRTTSNELDVEKKGQDEKEVLAEVPVGTGDVIWVTWDGPDDPENPLNWSNRRRWIISGVGIVFCGLVSLTVSGYAISQGSIITQLNTTKLLAILGITAFTITFGAAPLLLAPLSEVYGRNGIYLISAVVFAILFIPQGLAQNITTILVTRFLSGIAGSTAVSLVGGTLADVWTGAERGLPMALFAFAAFASTGLGPTMFGYVEEKYDFRVVVWIMLAMSTTFAVSLLFILRETRASVLLSRRAAKLRKETGDERYQSRDDFERGSFIIMMKTSLGRPIRMLYTEPVLLAFAIWISFCWGVLYILLESLPLVFGGVYGFSIGQSGLTFITQIVGSCIGLVVDYYCNIAYHKNVAKRGPEARLYTAMVGGILLPVGSWIYAWTSYSYVHWIFPCIGISILYCGLYLIYLATFSYLAENYTLYASSALSAQSFMRNCIGSVFPLFTNQLYDRLGVQGAGSLTAGIATLLSITPFILYKYGNRLRARSPFVKELARMAAEQELEVSK